MNAEQLFQSTRFSPGESLAGAAGRARVRPRLVIRVRALCIVRLIGLLLFAGVANVCLAGEGTGSSSGQATGPIRDPLNPQAYMAELASRLSSSDGKSLLLKGITTQAARRAGSSLPMPPSPKLASPASGTARPVANVPRTTGAVAGAPRPEGLKTGPVSQVAALTVWNGLSADNRAAQRALEHLKASPPTTAWTTLQPVANETTQKTQAAQVAQTADAGQAASTVSPLNRTLMSARPGLTLWTKPTPANLVEKIDIDASSMANEPTVADAEPDESQEQAPWSLGTDLDKYRAHAVKEGSRDSGESLKKALENAGLAVGDGVNIFVLGYGSDRAKPFRANDGKGFLDDPGRVPAQAGATAVNFADGVYSLADLITFDALPDPGKDAYADNNPLVRPLVFTGQAIGGVWKTTEEIGNAVTWGYFDNVTGCVGIVVEDLMEVLKHVGQAATNLARAPVQLIAGKKESTERAMDWVLLVPLEFVSNAAEMKGIANMGDYETAFEDKGVIGSVLEFGGSSFLVYRMVDELVDEMKDKNHRHKNVAEAETTATTDTPTTMTGSELLWVVDGEWTTLFSEDSFLYTEGEWPTITIYME